MYKSREEIAKNYVKITGLIYEETDNFNNIIYRFYKDEDWNEWGYDETGKEIFYYVCWKTDDDICFMNIIYTTKMI